jgi:hypothetical protein
MLLQIVSLHLSHCLYNCCVLSPNWQELKAKPSEEALRAAAAADAADGASADGASATAELAGEIRPR